MMLVLLCLFLAIVLWCVAIIIGIYVRYLRSVEALERLLDAMFMDTDKPRIGHEEQSARHGIHRGGRGDRG